MSIRLMTEVWEHSKQKGSPLLLLLAIADHANDRNVAFPSIDSLAKKTRLSSRNVQRLIDKLTQCKELTVELNAGPSGTNLYRIYVRMGGDNLSGVTSKVPECREGGDIQGTQMSPEPSGTVINRQEASLPPVTNNAAHVPAQTSSDDPRQKKTGDGKKARRGKAPKHTPEEIARANEFIAAWMAGFLRATEKPYPMEDKDYRLLYSFLAKNPEPVATFIELASKAWADQYRASWAGSISAFTWNYSKLIMAFREKRLLRSAPRVDPRAVNGF